MRASDLDMKLDYLRRRNGAPGGHLRHRHPDRQLGHRGLRDAALPAPGPARRRGHRGFDTWAATFGEVVTQVELAPEGGSTSG